MKFFIDTANLDQIREANDMGVFHHFGGRLLWKIINGKLDFVFRIVTCMHK